MVCFVFSYSPLVLQVLVSFYFCLQFPLLVATNVLLPSKTHLICSSRGRGSEEELYHGIGQLLMRAVIYAIAQLYVRFWSMATTPCLQVSDGWNWKGTVAAHWGRHPTLQTEIYRPALTRAHIGYSNLEVCNFSRANCNTPQHQPPFNR